MNPFLDAAQQYRRLGLHPIPVEPRGKRPILPTWREYCQRQPTEAEITEWWTNTPDANVALVLGRGMFAVDVDGPEGEAALGLEGIELPADAPTSVTGRGRHVFFSGDCDNRVGVLTKVDTRSDGGYVVAPPSVHPSGSLYAWLVPFEGRALTAPPLKLKELLSRPTRPTQVQKGDDWLTVALAGVGEGQRDDTCTKLAGYFIGKNISPEVVESLLRDWADRCTPVFPHDQVEKCVQSIAGRHEPEASIPPPDSIARLVHAVLARIRLPVKAALPTKLSGLDFLLDGGFLPGELTVMGARPAVGKTALASQIALSIAKGNVGVLFVTLEMTSKAIVRRMLSQESGVPARMLKTGELPDLEQSLLESGAARLSVLPLWVTQNALTVERLTAILQEFQPGQIGFLVVDYLQRMHGRAGERGDKRATVEYVAGALAEASKTFDLPVLCLSSLVRPPRDSGRNWHPTLADLRESGEIEHTADNVILLHRQPEEDICDVNLAKQRDGQVGHLRLRFRGANLLFEAA